MKKVQMVNIYGVRGEHGNVTETKKKNNSQWDVDILMMEIVLFLGYWHFIIFFAPLKLYIANLCECTT